MSAKGPSKSAVAYVSVVSDEKETKGYMLKFSKSSVSPNVSNGSSNGWKKRFFVLRGSTLNYYSDQNATKSKGELLVFGETQLKSGSENGQPYCITIWEPFSVLQLACASPADLQVWIAAFTRSMDIGKRALRNNMYRKALLQDGGTKKKYFILHSDVITYHKDKTQLLNVQGLVHMDKNTDMEYNDGKLLINVQDTSASYGLSIQFRPDGSGENGVYSEWKEALIAMLSKYDVSPRRTESPASSGLDTQNPIKMQGMLQMRIDDDQWVELMFYLTDAELLCYDQSSGGSAQLIESYSMTSNSGVFETNIGENSFELVTPSKVLHVLPTSAEEGAAWMSVMREVISQCRLDISDPLLQSAMLRIDDDEFITITVAEKKPLGITFERAGEWALVKVAKEEAGVPAGAALSMINTHSTVLATYASTIEQLKSWLPPLSLKFRLPPQKVGFLLKESRSRRDPTKTVWKKRYFLLGNGRLGYKESSDADAPLKGEYLLMGSAVSLVTPQEIGRFFCFKLISGMTALVVQSATDRQMLEWASTLYHAVAIANGGGHIINYERDRQLLSESELEEFGVDVEPQLEGLSAASALALAKSQTPRKRESPSSPMEKEDPNRDKEEAGLSLCTAMRSARYDHLFSLVEAIEHARRVGIDISDAMALLQQLQSHKVKVERFMVTLLAATKGRNAGDIASALREGESLGLSRELDAAHSLYDSLLLASAEEDLLAAVQAATMERLDELYVAIDTAKAAHVGVAKIVDAQTVAITLRKKKTEQEQCLANLATACQTRSLARIKSILAIAIDMGLMDLAGVIEAQAVLQAMKVEAVEESVRGAVKTATVDDFSELLAALEQARVTGLMMSPSLTIVHALDLAAGLQAKQDHQKELSARLAHAVDMEIADDIEAALLEIDLLSCSTGADPQTVAARSLLLQLREDERLVKFWQEAEEKAKAEEVIRVRIAAEEKTAMLRLVAERREVVLDAITDINRSLEAGSIHNYSDLKQNIDMAGQVVLAVSHGSSVPENLPQLIELICKARETLSLLVAIKAHYDSAVAAIQHALSPPMTIQALERAISDGLNKSEVYGFILGDVVNTARYEVERLKREQLEAEERALQEKLEAERVERVALEARRASEAAQRALLAEEERLRADMEEKAEKERRDKIARDKISRAVESIQAALILAEPGDSGGSTDGRVSVDSLTGWFGVNAVEGKITLDGSNGTTSLPELIDPADGAEEHSCRVIDALTVAISIAEDAGMDQIHPLHRRAVDALLEAKRTRTQNRYREAVALATVDNHASLETLVESVSDVDMVDSAIRVHAVAALNKLREAKTNRNRALQLLQEAMDAGNEALLERSITFTTSIGYAGLSEAVVASNMLTTIRRSALEVEIDNMIGQSVVDDFEGLEHLLARVEEQKALGIDVGKVLMMKQKLKELQERRRARDAALGAITSFLAALPTNSHDTASICKSRADIGAALHALAENISHLRRLITAAEAEGFIITTSANSTGSHSHGSTGSSLVDEAHTVLGSLAHAEAVLRLEVSLAEAMDLESIDSLTHAIDVVNKASRRLAQNTSSYSTSHQTTLLADASAQLQLLIAAKAAKKGALDALETILASSPTIDALEAALHKLSTLPKLASHTREHVFLLTEESYPIIQKARLELSSLRTQRASSALSGALTTSTVEEISTLENALKLAEDAHIDTSDALYATVKITLDRLKAVKIARLAAARQVEAAVGSHSIDTLESAIIAAAECGLVGDFIDGAKSLLFMLHQVDADQRLTAACHTVTPEKIDELADAISRAQAVHLDEYKVSHAIDLLHRMRSDRAERIILASTLENAIAANTLSEIEAALGQADVLLNQVALPVELVAFIETARHNLQAIRANKAKAKLLAEVKDGMRLKNASLLARAIDAALSSGIAIEDPVIVQGHSFLAQLYDQEAVQAMEEEVEERARKQRLIEAEIERKAAAAKKAHDDAEKSSLRITVGEEEEVDGVSLDVDQASESTPRKLARRKSKRYSFSMDGQASRDDLRKVFLNNGGASKPTDVHRAAEEVAGGFINAMQFSNIWRLITEEKGNLFKEMQMFKRFDRSGEGILREEDFIRGWTELAHGSAGGYSGEHLLKRIAALADSRTEDNDGDASPNPDRPMALEDIGGETADDNARSP